MNYTDAEMASTDKVHTRRSMGMPDRPRDLSVFMADSDEPAFDVASAIWRNVGPFPLLAASKDAAIKRHGVVA